MTLTADDARKLADLFLDTAKKVDDYLDAQWETKSIGRAEYETLSESAKTLLRLSSFMTTNAVGLSIAQMQDDSAELKDVVKKANRSLGKLKKVKAVIRLVAGVADLAVAITAKDAKATWKAVKGLADELK